MCGKLADIFLCIIRNMVKDCPRGDTKDEMESKDVVINYKPIIVHISPLGFLYYAKGFLAATKGIRQNEYFSPVPYFLHCHAIELALKAFLLGKGVSKKDLKKLGHNLEKILKKARDLGLSDFIKITSELEKEISKANKYYSSKDFEYFEVINAMTAYPELPDLLLLELVASSLVTNLEPFCLKV